MTGPVNSSPIRILLPALSLAAIAGRLAPVVPLRGQDTAPGGGDAAAERREQPADDTAQPGTARGRAPDGQINTHEDAGLSTPPATDTTRNGIAAVLPIHGMITDVTVESLSRRIDQARRDGASVIIFNMDTPGGLVTSSIAIADLIREMPNIKTVAWVNPNAHSGGSLVAVACDEIVMARSSRIGDSQVIMGGPIGAGAVPKDLQPKAYTPVLADFRTSAKLNGYSQVLCESFVLPDREVWWLENIDTGKRNFVFRDEKIRLLGETEDASTDDDDDTAQEGNAKDRNAKDHPAKDGTTEKDGDADQATRAEAAKPEQKESEWKLIETYHDPLLDGEVEALQPIVREDQLLEMSAGEAQAYGFSKGIVVDEEGLKARYKVASILRLAPSWSEHLAYWLTSMYVRGFLMLIILLGAYVEFHTPGVGVPGLVALVCLAVFVGAPYLTGLANIWEILLVLLGVLLIALEVFVIPGFGLAGISGIALIIVGLLATFVPDEPGRSIPLYFPSLPGSIRFLQRGLITLVASMAMSLAGMVVLSRYLPRAPVFRRLVPANPTPSEVLTEDAYRGAARVGDIGEAEGPLHPAGKARFGSVLVDVVTQGEYLTAHSQVQVIERHGNRVVVRAAT